MLLRLSFAAILLGGLGQCSDEPACAWADEPRFHLLIVADTNDPSIGESVKADLNWVEDIFRGNVPAAQLRVATLSENRVTPQQILAAAGGLAVRPKEDVAVFYYSGHGAFDRRADEHVLLPGRQRLLRKEVRAALERLRPRLAVLMTDTCSVFLPSPVPTPMLPPAERVSPLFRALFLQPTGLIDISCTRPGEVARGDSNGGYFTWALWQFVEHNQQRSSTWSELLGDVNRRVRRSHDDARQTACFVTRQGEDGLNAAAESRDPEPPRQRAQGVRFGVSAEATPYARRMGGVQVTLVMPGYPGTDLRRQGDGKQFYLVPGRDIITHINGVRVTSKQELVDAVYDSPPRMVVRVYDTQTRSSDDYDVQLRN